MKFRENIDAILVLISLVSLLIPSAVLVITSSTMFLAFATVSVLLIELIVVAEILSILASGVYFV